MLMVIVVQGNPIERGKADSTLDLMPHYFIA
jgi:hypothetical protein